MFPIVWNCAKMLLIFLSLNTNQIVFVSGTENKPLESKIEWEPQICTTELCKIASNSIIQFMDESIEPCDDFYKFACGNFETVNKDLPNAVSVSHITQLNIDVVLDTFLESTTESKIMADLIKKYGGWPVVEGDNWDKDNWSLSATMGKMLRDGLNTNAILAFTTAVDTTGKKYLAIRQPEFYIGKDLLLENYEPYLNFMVNTTYMFNASESDAKIQMDQALYFERQLAEITNQREELQAVTIHQLQTGYPYWDWLKFIRSVLPNDMEIDESELIFVEIGSQYLMRLEVLLKQTQKRTIANFLIWRAVLFSSQYLNADLYQLRLKFFNEKQDEISSYECFGLTKKHLPVAMSTIFFIRFGNQTSKVLAALKLANNVRNEFVYMLREVSWMDNEKKSEAIQKAKNMSILVAQPTADMKHQIEIDKYYDGLKLSGSNFFENVLRVLRFDELKKYRKVHQFEHTENHLTYHSMADEVNAFYYNNDNTVYIPAAKLEHAFFNADLPNYLNYGSLGMTIGHEITHDIYNSHLGNSNDWSREMKEEFYMRANCYEEQYSNYGISGKKEINENIADNCGVKAAYRAYQNFIHRYETEALLPGLEYTQQQLFWISAAQLWCSKDTTSDSEKTAKTYNSDDDYNSDYDYNSVDDYNSDDVHSPNQYRVIGMVQNMRQFARDFKCSKKSIMNPISKCDMW